MLVEFCHSLYNNYIVIFRKTHRGLCIMDYSKAKDEFVFRQSEIDDRIIYFEQHYNEWIASLPPEVTQIIMSMLEHFDYYSHQDSNIMLRALHEKLCKQCDSEMPEALYTYIKKKNGKICSSIDYWLEYRMINQIDKNYCTDDICAFPVDDWQAVDSIVVIDDCCGTGGSLEKFLKNSGKDFSGKTIYYPVLHALNASTSILRQIEDLHDVTIKLLAINERDKASEIVSGKDAEATRELLVNASKKMEINPDYSLGKDNSEGLMAFHNNTPNNTIGLFWFESDKNKPVLPRDYGETPSWRPKTTQMKAQKKARKKNNYMAVKQNG